MVTLLNEVPLLLLVVSCPASVTAPVPIKVVPTSASEPVLLTVTGPLIVDVAAPSDSVPLLTLTVVEELVWRLRTESLGPVVTFPVLVRSITAVSAVPGTLPPTQLVGVSQAPPLGATVVFHWIVDSTIRCSSPSISGARRRARLRPGERGFAQRQDHEHHVMRDCCSW